MKRFAGIRMGRFASQRDVAGIADQFCVSDIIHRRAFLAVDVGVFYIGDGDGGLAAGNPFRRRQERFDPDRFIGGEVAHELFGLLLTHDFIQTRQPLCRRRMLGRVGHDDLAFVYAAWRDLPAIWGIRSA